MGTTRSKQVAAAVAAVLQYAAEVEAAASVSPAAPPPPAPARPGPALWGSAGRQDAMMLRSLWQRRITRSW